VYELRQSAADIAIMLHIRIRAEDRVVAVIVIFMCCICGCDFSVRFIESAVRHSITRGWMLIILFSLLISTLYEW